MLRYIFRITLITLTLAVFAIGQGLLFWGGERPRIWWCRLCAKWVLSSLNIQVSTQGQLPDTPHLIVSNHFSWIDPLVLLQLGTIQFVTHTEVRDHPMFGWITRLGLCHFWDRRGSQLKQELQFAAQALEDHHLGVFPEGTSHNGLELLDFKSPPFEIAIQSAKDICPIFLKVIEVNGDDLNWDNHQEVCYYGGMTFGQSLKAFLTNDSVSIQVQVGELIPVDEKSHRKSLKSKIQELYQETLYPSS